MRCSFPAVKLQSGSSPIEGNGRCLLDRTSLSSGPTPASSDPDDRSVGPVIRLIAAIDVKRGLGDGHGIPWQGKLPSDAEYFRTQTAEGLIVMGFRTYEEFDHPLHDRANFVASRPGAPPLRTDFHAVEDLSQFLADHARELVWIIGGAGLYEATLASADELYITQLDRDFHCTKFFPAFDGEFLLDPGAETRRENDISFRFERWRRRQQN
jgi:dihydrofolate reductase